MKDIYKEKPIISIIVPVYKTEEYLEKCLNSIQRQTFKEFEVIIINDGSPDNSQKIIDKYCRVDKRFISYIQDNSGLSSARNTGIEMSNGEYIAFIDSDDWLGESHFQNLYDYIKNDQDLVLGRYTIVDQGIRKTYSPLKKITDNKIINGEKKEREIILPLIGPQTQIFYKNNDVEYCHMCVWKNLYRRKIIVDNRLFFISEREIYMEDYYFNLNYYYYAKNVVYANSCEYYHLVVQGSLSKSYRSELHDMMCLLFKKTENFIETHSFMIDKNEYKIRLNNFKIKTCVDVCKNYTLLGKNNTFHSSYTHINKVVNSPLFINAYKEYKKMHIPIFYSIFCMMIKKRKIKLLTLSLIMTHKIDKIYKYYKYLFNN